ncbi:class I SAM-dependent methyltransferase [Nodularia spumigena CS-584]|jgi:cyclopropane fatty-acyl-phospholipid synthase-like methyltransferase|uniref:Class I SAM-dependent methyltransferase n=2 Tax=Nodularia spumigena TaxID=70799 RepID=A0ABU5UNW6_NODSP|nr:class I SAM-dependent methyltransferase [Nodularia spumigena]AHJ28813.1 Methyltransferase type 11 [Nodularia spumigena CCY9414]EAW43024.1 hypothetical protein N9414_13305 [Nodularia spumigena CCY9414]MDB9381705.1 class I SAM-dependent methyltransferase [Nodularia spumigena CS-584]MEA5607967.1 class I SAM-dependent methyltransferase [Nodularia spumigena UHCC 0060]MEA5614077.1 class I SAM-dependent methyltransferase [Nodularia spumigena UHCC 0040]
MNNKQKDIFFQIHQNIPREGPGDSISTKNAFLKLVDLPPHPKIIDIGCGPGFQTLDLASLTNGTIIAIDNHPFYVNELKQKVLQQGLSEKITVINADMFALDFPDASFDIIWAEGSIYIIGSGLTQNHEKTNHKEREGHEGKRVAESYCVSPMGLKMD